MSVSPTLATQANATMSSLVEKENSRPGKMGIRISGAIKIVQTHWKIIA